MKQTAVAIIDMQNAYFANPALKERQQKLVTACNQLIQAAQERGLPVFMVTTEQHHDRSTWTLNMLADRRGYLFPETDDVQTVPGLLTDGTIPVVKTRDSAFFGTPFALMLHNLGISQLILAGVSTHTCVAQTATDAYAANFAVTIATDAVASHQPQFHPMILHMLVLEYRQKLHTVKEITSSWQKAA